MQAGDVIAMIDDRKYFDELETDRRLEQDALNEVDNAHRRADNSKRAVAQAEEAQAREDALVVARIGPVVEAPTIQLAQTATVSIASEIASPRCGPGVPAGQSDTVFPKSSAGIGMPVIFTDSHTTGIM